MKNLPNKYRKLFIALALMVLTFIFVIKLPITADDEIVSKANQKTENTPTDISQLMEQAELVFNQGEYQAAIDIYLQILEQEPDNTAAMDRIAHTYRYWGKFEEAEVWFKKVIAIDPNDPFWPTDLGKLYRNMQRYEEAEEAFMQALAIDPNYAEAYGYGLGYLYWEEQRFDEAEVMFKKALELDPDNELATYGLGDLYRETGRFAEAEAMYQKAFVINPHSEAYLGLAWLYMYQDRYQEAETALLKYLNEIREKAEVYYTLGQSYMGQEKYTEAEAAFARAHELNPDETFYAEMLAEATAKKNGEVSN